MSPACETGGPPPQVCNECQEDDVLVECDDCLRGFHLRCHVPPLAALPEAPSRRRSPPPPPASTDQPSMLKLRITPTELLLRLLQGDWSCASCSASLQLPDFRANSERQPRTLREKFMAGKLGMARLQVLRCAFDST